MNQISHINMNIPGKIAWDELVFLGKLAASVPKGGKIVEVGPLYGRSTFTLASSAPHAKVISIDTFENAKWIQKYASSSSKIPTFGLEAFKHFTGHLPNSEAIVGYSPAVVEDWSEPIDMYFEDATHGNPNLKENMDFWINHLKPGGIACGHDFTLRFPDVKREAESWGKKWGARPVIVGSLWALRKPLNNEPSEVISLPFDEDDEHRTLIVKTRNRRLGPNKSLSGYWCGSHLDNDALQTISVELEEPAEDLQIEYRIGNPEFGRSDWVAGGETAAMIKGKKSFPIWEFGARLLGPAAKDYKVFYRLAFRQIGNGGYKVSETTDWYSDGSLCSARRPGANACSITIAVAKSMPLATQAEFHPAGLRLLLSNARKSKAVLARAVNKTLPVFSQQTRKADDRSIKSLTDDEIASLKITPKPAKSIISPPTLGASQLETPQIKQLLELAKELAENSDENTREHAELLHGWLQSAFQIERGEPGKLGFRKYLLEDFQKYLDEAGIKKGLVCEIGGPHNSFASDMPEYDFEYLSLYPDKAGKVLVADATQCDYVPSERYDAIFSVSVFEHISKPWKAAEHLSRLLKPGGICYHAAPFSYFYHGAPADFWRYTPDALKLLFSELKPLRADFYGKNRRRDNRGSVVNAVDRDGGPEFAVDAFGGWRENWFSIYVGQKDEDYRLQKIKDGEWQVIINLMKHLTESGLNDNDAAKKLKSILKKISVNEDHEIVMNDSENEKGSVTGLNYSVREIINIWKHRGRNGIKVSYARFVMAAKVGL